MTNWFKNLFGIESPSKLFKNLIGKNLALGLGEGFTDEMKSVSEEMAGSIPAEFNTPSINADSPVYGASALNKVSSNLFSNGLNSNKNLSNLQVNDSNGLVSAFKQDLTGLAFEIDEDKIGQLLISKVERVVFS